MSNSNQPPHLSNVLTDPDDFEQTCIPELSNLDTLLRCDICKEFYTSPVLSSCGHSFCSLCIRRYLVSESKCALCGRELRESGLRRNGVLEELVSVFIGLRPNLVDSLIPKVENEVVKTEKVCSKEKSPDVGLDEGKDLEIIDLDDIQNDSGDDEVLIIKDVKKRKSPVGLDMILKKKPKNDENNDKKVKMGECPICLKKLPLDVLQTTHIDSCLTDASLQETTELKHNSSPSSVSRLITKPQKLLVKQVQPNNITIQKLPKLDLKLTTPQLKSKLQALQLPTTGTRAILEQRYIEYATLWNANCDSGKPKDARVLRRELNRWENLVLRDLESKKGEQAKKDTEREKDKDNMNKDEWRELLKKAKEARSKKNDNDTNKENVDSGTDESEPFFV